MVKQEQTVKRGDSFEAEAFRVLREIPGLNVTMEPVAGDKGVDAVLRFAGAEARVAVEFKTRASAAAAWQLVEYARANPEMPVLLITNESTAQAREILKEHGIGVVDGLGNAHVELPGLLLHLKGDGQRQQARPARLTRKAGLLAQKLLLDPHREWQVQDLANDVGVSLGLAHRVLARLEHESIVAVEGTGRNRVRRVINPTALLDLWTEETNDRPTNTKCYVLAQTPGQLIQTVADNLGRAGVDYAMTGAAAASLVAPFITAVPVADVWVKATADPRKLCNATGGELVTGGQNVVFLQAKDDTPLAFRQKVGNVWIANSFRLYADLRRDPRRGREQADHLRQAVIGF